MDENLLSYLSSYLSAIYFQHSVHFDFFDTSCVFFILGNFTVKKTDRQFTYKGRLAESETSLFNVFI